MELSVNAFKGVQAGYPYYTSMIPIWQLLNLIRNTNMTLPVEQRAQRTLNKSRIPEMKKYILDNPDSYVFSAVTLCADEKMFFRESAMEGTPKFGMLTFTEGCRIAIVDGQHRMAAISGAVEENKKLGYEHMPVVIFHDFGLERSQQMFSDLNRYVIRPTKSLNVMYDNRDPMARIAVKLIRDLPVFRDIVELERATVPASSRKLFTVSAIYNATTEALHGIPIAGQQEIQNLAAAFWTKLDETIPAWECVRNGSESATVIRSETICTQAVTLIALGRTAAYAYAKHHDYEMLAGLTNVNWLRDNPEWQGIVVNDHKVSGTRASTQALTQYLIETMER